MDRICRFIRFPQRGREICKCLLGKLVPLFEQEIPYSFLIKLSLLLRNEIYQRSLLKHFPLCSHEIY